MLGFKKTIPINEFGLAVLRYADEFISADAGRSLGTQFENWDGSRGWWTFLQGRGMSISALKLYQRLYTHCVLQANFKGFSTHHRWEMVHGAITCLAETPEGYNLERVFAELEAVFDGEFKLNPSVETLNSNARLNFSAYPDVGILASRYLIHAFIIPKMQNSGIFIENFNLYSSTVGSSVATANRAMDQITGKVKIGPQSSPPTAPAPWSPSESRTSAAPSTQSRPSTGPISPFAWAGIDNASTKPLKLEKDRDGFKIDETIYYRALGIGRIVDIEKFESIDGPIERFVIEFEEDEAELRVPVSRLREMSSRKPLVLTDDDVDGAEEHEPAILESDGFKVDEHVVYPQHGVGKIVAIEWQEIAGSKLKVFVISFKKDKMTLRVPTDKHRNVGLRRLADEI